MTEKLTMESTAYEEPVPKSPAPRRANTESKSSWSLSLPFFARSPSTKVKKSQVSAAELVTVPTQEGTVPPSSTSDLRVQFEENEKKIVANYDSIISTLKQEIEAFKAKEIGYQKLIADVQLQKCNIEEVIGLKDQETQSLHYDLQNAVTTCQQFSQQVMLLQQEYSVLESNFNQCLFDKNRAQTIIQEYEFQISSFQRSAASSSTLSGSQSAEHEKIVQLSVEIENMARERDNLQVQLEQLMKTEAQRQPSMMGTLSSSSHGFEEKERQLVSNYEALIASIKLEVSEYKQRELKVQKEMSDIQLQKCSFEADAVQKGEELEMVRSEYQLICGRVQYLEDQLSQSKSGGPVELKATLFEEKIEKPMVEPSKGAHEAVMANMNREISTYKEKEIAFQQTVSDLQLLVQDLQSKGSQREEGLVSMTSESQAVQEQLKRLQEEYRLMEYRYQESIEEKRQMLERQNESENLCANLQMSISRLSADLSSTASIAEQATWLKAEVDRLNDEKIRNAQEIERLQTQLSNSTATVTSLQQSLFNNESIVAMKGDEVVAINAEYTRVLTNAQYLEEQLNQLRYNFEYTESTYSAQMVQMQQEYRNMEVRCSEFTEERDRLQRQYNESVSRYEELQSSTSQASTDLAATAATLNKHIAELKADVERLTNEKNSVVREMEQLQSQLYKANSNISDLQQDLRKSESTASKKTDELAAITSEYQTALNNVRYMEEQLTQMNYNYQYMDSTYSGQMMQMQQEYRNMEVRCYECIEERDRAQRQNAETVSRCEELQTSSSTLTSQVAGLKADVERLTNEKNSALRDVEQLQSQLYKANSNISDLQQDLRKSESIATKKTDELAIITSEYQTALNNVRYMEEQLTQMNYNYQYMDSTYSGQMMQMQQEYRNMEVRCYECIEERDRIQRQYAETVSRCEELQSTVSRLTGELSATNASKAELNSQVRNLNAQVDRLTTEKATATRDMEQVMAQLTASKDALSACKQQLSKSESDYQSVSANAKSLEEQIAQLRQEYQTMDTYTNQVRQEYQTMDTYTNQLRQEYQSMESSYTMQISQIQQEYVTMESTYCTQINQLKEEYTTMESSYSTNMNQLRQEYGNLEYNYNQMQQNLIQMESKYKASADERNAINQRYNESESRGISLRSNISSLTAELSATSSQVKALQADIDRLVSEKHSSDEGLKISRQKEEVLEQQCKSLQFEVSSMQQQLQQEYQTKESMLTEYSYTQSELYATATNANALKNEYNELLRRYQILQRDNDVSKLEISSLRKDLEVTEDRIRKFFNAPLQSPPSSSFQNNSVEVADHNQDIYRPSSVGQGVIGMSANVSQKITDPLCSEYPVDGLEQVSIGNANKLNIQDDQYQESVTHNLVGNQSAGQLIAISSKVKSSMDAAPAATSIFPSQNITATALIPDEQQHHSQILGLGNTSTYSLNFPEVIANNSLSSNSVSNTQQADAASSMFPQPTTFGAPSRINSNRSSFNALSFQTLNGTDESRAPQHYVENPLRSNDFGPASILGQPSGFGAPDINTLFNQSDFIVESKKSANNSSMNLAQFGQESADRDQHQNNSTHSQQLFGSLSQKAMGPLSAAPLGVVHTNNEEQSNPFANNSGTASGTGFISQVKDEQQPGFQVLCLGSGGGSFNNFSQVNVNSTSSHSIPDTQQTGFASSQFPNSSSAFPNDNPQQSTTFGNSNSGVLGGLGSYHSNRSSFNAPPFKAVNNGADESHAPQHIVESSLQSNTFGPAFIASQPSGFGASNVPSNHSGFSGLVETKISTNNSSMNLAQFGQEGADRDQHQSNSTHSQQLFGSLPQKAMGPLSAAPFGVVHTSAEEQSNPFANNSTTAGTASLFPDQTTAFEGLGYQAKDEQPPGFQVLGLGSGGGSFNNSSQVNVNSTSSHSIPDTQQTGFASSQFPNFSSAFPNDNPQQSTTFGNSNSGVLGGLGSYHSNRSSFNAPPFQAVNNGADATQQFVDESLSNSSGFGTPFAPFNQSDFGGLVETTNYSSLIPAQLGQESTGFFAPNCSVKANVLTSDGLFPQGNISEPTGNLSIEYGGEEEQGDDLLNSPVNFDIHSGLNSTRGSYGHSTSFNSPQVDKLDRSGNSNDLEDSMDDQQALNGFSSLSVSAGTGDFNNFGNSFLDFGSSTGTTSQNQQMFFSKSVQF